MRLTSRSCAALVVAACAGIALTGCQGSDLPMPPNGPSGQSFSTNNALVRIVNGSPTAGSACIVAGQATTCIDIEVDGIFIARGVPYPTIPALDQFAILPYVSVPSGQALIQIFQSPTTPGGPEGSLVYGLPASISTSKKYSFVLGGQAPIPPSVFFPGYLFNDGLFNPGLGNSSGTFHNASPNAGSAQFAIDCAACSGPTNIGPPVSAGGPTVGPINLVGSGEYVFTATTASTTATLTPSQLDGLDVNDVLPDPTLPTKPNISVYVVDTLGLGPTNLQEIGTFDMNG